MSFSESHPRSAHGQFATGGVIDAGRVADVWNGTIYTDDGWKLSGVKVYGLKFGTDIRPVDVPIPVRFTPARPSWRRPVRVWRWWLDRRRGIVWRDRQETRSGTFNVRTDGLWGRRVYQWLGVEPPPLASRPVRAIARALTWGIVLRMVRGG